MQPSKPQKNSRILSGFQSYYLSFTTKNLRCGNLEMGCIQFLLVLLPKESSYARYEISKYRYTSRKGSSMRLGKGSYTRFLPFLIHARYYYMNCQLLATDTLPISQPFYFWAIWTYWLSGCNRRYKQECSTPNQVSSLVR